MEPTASSIAGHEGRRHGFKNQEQNNRLAQNPHRRGLDERHEQENLAALLSFCEWDDCFMLVSYFYTGVQVFTQKAHIYRRVLSEFVRSTVSSTLSS